MVKPPMFQNLPEKRFAVFSFSASRVIVTYYILFHTPCFCAYLIALSALRSEIPTK